MKTTHVNWQTYLDTFPDRYTQPGGFDAKIESLLVEDFKSKCNALDVGGGVLGTQALRKNTGKTWLSDPYITTCPDWMVGNLFNIMTIQRAFDFIVARGSFNYLTITEIEKIQSILTPSGVFVFNTFKAAKTGERRYTNTRTGISGTERYFDEGGMVRHQLQPDNSDEIIEHHFRAYTEDAIKLMFPKDFTLFTTTNGNSLHVAATRR